MKTGRTILILATLCVASQSLGAQNYRAVIGRNLWNTGSNVTGIRQDSASVSFAETYFTHNGGNFKSISMGSSVFNFGARAASIKHLENWSMIGSFSFDQQEGDNMKGSMFVTPGSYPIDIIEFTPGHKTRQTYAFDGGVSVDVAPEWRIGGKMDFTSTNYAKMKDLRYTNYRLDFKLAPGVQYHSGDFALGFNAVIGKSSETITADQVGSTVSSYYAFLEKGACVGVYEVWDGSGTHLSEVGVSGFPVKEITGGAAFQASWRNLFADVEFVSSQGTVGEKQYVWFRFPGWKLKSDVVYLFSTGDWKHSARLAFDINGKSNYETVIEKVLVGGITTVEEYGSNRIYSSRTFSIRPSYGLTAPSGNSYSLSLSYKYSDELSSTIYPYLFSTKMNMWSVNAGANFRLGRFVLSPSLNGGWGGSRENLREAVSDSGVESEIYILEPYHLGKLELLTATRVGGSLALKYSFRNGLYASASVYGTKAFNIQVLSGDTREGCSVTFGYNF